MVTVTETTDAAADVSTIYNIAFGDEFLGNI